MTNRRRKALAVQATQLAIAREACERAIRALREVGGDAEEPALLLDLVRMELDILYDELRDELEQWMPEWSA